MAEKRVSVRLAAVGGKQVRAELEGIGNAGARGFGRLSSEMERANARLVGFWRTAGLALAAVSVAAVAAGALMIRSGLQTVDAQAKLAQSMQTTVKSVQILTFAGELAGVSMEEIAAATKKLTLNLSNAAGGTGTAVKALERLNLTAAELQAMPLDERIAAIQDALVKFVSPAERAAVASDLFGAKAALAFSRIDSATLREAARDVKDFGVAVSAMDSAQIERTNDAIGRLSLIWVGIANRLTVAVAPALERVATTLADMARATGPIGIAITALFDNLVRLATYAATFAAMMAGRWVLGFAAAALSVRGLATALVFLRGALIRTGIGALIVGAGELVFQFGRLSTAAGGFGAAMVLLKDLVVEVWQRISFGIDAAAARMNASWSGITAAVAEAMQAATESVVGFGNTAVNTFEGAFEAIKAIWGALPAAIGDLVIQAANSLISGVEAMLNSAVAAINLFLGGVSAVRELLGGSPIRLIADLDIGEIKNQYAGAASAAGTAAKDAFDRAFADNALAVPDVQGAIGRDARDRQAAFTEAAGMLADAASRPLTAWQALKAAILGTGREGAEALGDAAGAAEDLEAGLDGAGKAAGGAGAAAGRAGAAIKKAAEEAKAGWDAVRASLSDYAAEAADWGKGVGGILVNAFQSAESAFRQFVLTGKLDFKSLIANILADLATLVFKQAVLGPLAKLLSGALGGIFAPVSHAGGMVGAPGPGRMVPALAFAGAPRMHSGGFPGLRPDEVPSILLRGERVLSRAEVARGVGQGRSGGGSGGFTISIDARGAQEGVAEQIAATMRAAIPEIARIAKASVADGRRRGHAF